MRGIRIQFNSIVLEGLFFLTKMIFMQHKIKHLKVHNSIHLVYSQCCATNIPLFQKCFIFSEYPVSYTSFPHPLATTNLFSVSINLGVSYKKSLSICDLFANLFDLLTISVVTEIQDSSSL